MNPMSVTDTVSDHARVKFHPQTAVQSSNDIFSQTALHHPRATRAQCSTKYDDAKPLQRTEQTPDDRLHVYDVHCDGDRDHL